MKPELWWDKQIKDQRLADAIHCAVEDIEKEQYDIHEAHERHAKLYQGFSPPGLGFQQASRRRDYNKNQVTKNIIKSVCDTATSIVGRTRPKATFVLMVVTGRRKPELSYLTRAFLGHLTKLNCGLSGKRRSEMQLFSVLVL